MKKLLFIVGIALCTLCMGCSKESENGQSDSDQLTMDMLTGNWAANGSSYYYTMCLRFNIDGQMGKLYYEDLYENSKGVMATGTYSLSGMDIIATFTDVRVYGGMSDPNMTEWHGFTHGQTHTMTFKVKSITATELVLLYEDGHTYVYTVY